jgi:hypothetical protein
MSGVRFYQARIDFPELCLARLTGKVGTRLGRCEGATSLAPRGNTTCYLTAKSFSNNSSESLAPSSDNHTDLAFVAGSEM